MRVLAAAGAALMLTACATSAPPAKTPGVVGKFDDGRVARLVRVNVLGADAQSCTLGTALPVRSQGESFDFADDGHLGDVLSPMDVSCKLTDGPLLSRNVRAVLDGKQFNRDRATQVIMTGIIAGPLGAAASAAMSGSMKGRYYRLPSLIHVAPPERAAEFRDQAVANWTAHMEAYRSDKAKGAMPISDEALLELRDQDLAFFNPSASASTTAASNPAGRP